MIVRLAPALDNPTLLCVIPGLAATIGLNEAIVLSQLAFWISISDQEHDGMRWTYQSTREMQRKAFTFWSLATIQRAIQSLEALNLIFVRDDLNEHAYDYTRWFALNTDALEDLARSTGAFVVEVFQNETGVFQDETAPFQNETTIPEITTETTPDIKTTQNSPNSASGAGKLPNYGYKNRVPRTRLGAAAGESDRKYVTAKDSDWPTVGGVVMSLLSKYKRGAELRLTLTQAADLRKPVVTRTGEHHPSPEEEARDYPDLWKAYTDQIENTAAWRKRFLENKEPVTAGKIVQLLRGYDHYEGWLSFKQPQARPAAKSSMGVNDLIGDLYGGEE